ncbi:IBR finger domain protein [Talaromyces stipitatus ATCC 10500]|uniref:IBR finger domain protein n=1 Tax=Talaromyces stipitatus (strain ATCC 10500 / CBS 375.48 / QM 6759 / NRRL 1006) TaxID=441959 RepID=B8MNF5_TALSN|nr:IBR finger domain protein [Talaromyces stipitatus ATCC 10500]EED14044.1 IBR finger domain protein [Talaromyces stipitatus ATCC 10500]
MNWLLESDIDLASASLIVQLQIEDAEHYFNTSKGKSRDPTSEEEAFQLQNEELQKLSRLLLDKRMAESVAAAVRANGQMLADGIAQEETAVKDRDIAHRWTGDQFPVAAEETAKSSQDPSSLDDKTLKKLRILYVSNLQGSSGTYGTETVNEETERGESSAWAAKRTRQPASSMRRCVACGEETEFVNVVRVPCRHEYCRTCLEDLFKASMTDETLFPPKCCRQPIAMNFARIFLKSDLVQQFEKKKIEFETPNRTYCYNTQCSVFIPPAHINGEIATCPNCGFTTCTSCKARAHTGDCLDEATQQLMATARENGWQRCYSCWRMVELNYGCNHMTCRCGAQFCYNCGERWKTCQCEQWDQHRLLSRAHQIIDREQNSPGAANPALVAPIPRTQQPTPIENEEPRSVTETPQPAQQEQAPWATLVVEAIGILRNNHECEHWHWRWATSLADIYEITILITGCSDGGLGSHLALAFHKAGWRVFASARNLTKLKQATTAGIEAIQLDVTSDKSIVSAVSQISELTHGSLDVLLNNAGGGYSMPLMDLELDQARKLFDLNVWSIISVTRAFLPLLSKSQYGGMVVNNTSCSSVPAGMQPFAGAYAASKAAAASITEILRLELAPFGIKSINLMMGAVKSNFFENTPASTLPPTSLYNVAKETVERAMSGQDNMADADDPTK